MKVQGAHYRSIWYDHSDFKVKIIDQRWLPHDFKIVALTSFKDSRTDHLVDASLISNLRDGIIIK